MAVRQILTMGHPILQQVAAPVTEFNSKQLDQLIDDMFDTMEAANGAGIAAPQIGESLRVVIFGVDHNPRYPDAENVPTTILINPTIEIIDQETEEGWEGCLSVPGLRGLVPRAVRLQYHGYDQYGDSFTRQASDFHARVVQHEVDHLDGILYPQRIKNLRNFGFEEQLFAASES